VLGVVALGLFSGITLASGLIAFYPLVPFTLTSAYFLPKEVVRSQKHTMASLAILPLVLIIAKTKGLI
jgi:hypothetical protein